MERESLLSILIMLLGGLALQPFAVWRSRELRGASTRELERRSWLRLWYPLVPLLLVAAWLGGWALVEPDPVPGPLDPWIVLAAGAPFALLFGRAAARVAWAVLRQPPDCGVSTVGLIQPQVVFSPFLAKQLDDGVIRAADLAAAVLASVRYLSRVTPEERASLIATQLAHARLIGDSRALRDRVSRLLAPLPQTPAAAERRISLERAVLLLLPVLLTALTLGVIYGERVMHPLLGLTS